jgi:hypothetical protein
MSTWTIQYDGRISVDGHHTALAYGEGTVVANGERRSNVEGKVSAIFYSHVGRIIGIGIDELVHKSGFESSLLAITLLELEMKNCILSLPGKRYKSIA